MWYMHSFVYKSTITETPLTKDTRYAHYQSMNYKDTAYMYITSYVLIKVIEINYLVVCMYHYLSIDLERTNVIKHICAPQWPSVVISRTRTSFYLKWRYIQCWPKYIPILVMITCDYIVIYTQPKVHWQSIYEITANGMALKFCIPMSQYIVYQLHIAILQIASVIFKLCTEQNWWGQTSFW